jgi:hypothetical protein
MEIIGLFETRFGDVLPQSFGSTILCASSFVAPFSARFDGFFHERCSMLATGSPFVAHFLSATVFPGGSYGHIEAGVANIVCYFLSRAFDTWKCLN